MTDSAGSSRVVFLVLLIFILLFSDIEIEVAAK